MTEIETIAEGLTKATATALVRGDWSVSQGTELERFGLIEHVPKHGFRCCNTLGLAVRAHIMKEQSNG